MSFIAGRYTVSYDAGAVGQIEAGITLEHAVFKQLITGDNFAQTPQDGIFQGMEVFAQFALLEYNAAKAAAALWPYGSTYLTMDTVIGTLDVTVNAKTLLLTALAGTPAAATPATITMNEAVLQEGFVSSIIFDPNLRTVPLRMRIYPVNGVFGTTT